MTVRIGIPLLPGSLFDDAARAVRIAGGEPVLLWYRDADLRGVDAVVVPGGAIYGNYLRVGALARTTPVIVAVIDAARQGLPVLGVGSGFHVLCEAGLLPGSLVANRNLRFVSRPHRFTVETAATTWTPSFERGETLRLPVTTGAGQYLASEAELDELENSGRVVLRFAGPNPTGAARGIAGVSNAAGNVVGLLPAPQNAVEPGFGPSTDGRGFFAPTLAARA